MEGCSKKIIRSIVALLSHSHFNAFFHLSRMLATKRRNSHLRYPPFKPPNSPTPVQGWGDLPFYFQDLSVPESPLPPGRQNVNNISRDMLPLIFDLIQKMQKPLEALMAELTGREYYESGVCRLPNASFSSTTCSWAGPPPWRPSSASGRSCSSP
jgi:hypothetical protein